MEIFSSQTLHMKHAHCEIHFTFYSSPDPASTRPAQARTQVLLKNVRHLHRSGFFYPFLTCTLLLHQKFLYSYICILNHQQLFAFITKITTWDIYEHQRLPYKHEMNGSGRAPPYEEDYELPMYDEEVLFNELAVRIRTQDIEKIRSHIILTDDLENMETLTMFLTIKYCIVVAAMLIVQDSEYAQVRSSFSSLSASS